MSYLVDTKYLSETLSEEELYQNAFDRSKSNDSMENLKTTLRTFNHFTVDMFSREKDQVLKDLMIEYKKNRDTRAPLIILKKYLKNNYLFYVIPKGQKIIHYSKSYPIKDFPIKKDQKIINPIVPKDYHWFTGNVMVHMSIFIEAEIWI